MTEIIWDVIDREEPRGQSVTMNGVLCTARHCCTWLNRLTKENRLLKSEINHLTDVLASYEEEYGDME